MDKWKKNKIDYSNKYNKQAYINLSIRIRKDNTEVLKQLESVPSKNAYIVYLIEKDIEDKKALEEKNKKIFIKKCWHVYTHWYTLMMYQVKGLG